MKIITVNVHQEVVDQMGEHTKEFGLYQSRSELIRVAIREFLIRELKKLDESIERGVIKQLESEKKESGIDLRTVRLVENIQ